MLTAMPHFTPPTKVDVHQRGMMGFSFRQLTIVGISLAAALGLLVVLSGAPAFLRVSTALLAAGLGLALAFGQVDGKTLETWAFEFLQFRRRPRYMLHRAERGEPEARVTLSADALEATPAPATPAEAPASEPAPAAPQAPQVIYAPSFAHLALQSLVMSVIAGLSIWLYDGGAIELQMVARQAGAAIVK
jgi:hypothetical protein